MWSQNLKLQRTLKTGTDSCRARDLWVTNYVPLHNINRIALSFTSKEIGMSIYMYEYVYNSMNAKKGHIFMLYILGDQLRATA